MKARGLLLGALVALSACGPKSHSDQALTETLAAPLGLLVVVLGGFTSCSPQVLHGRAIETSTMAPLASALRVRGPLHFLMSCFRDDGVIHVVTSDDLNSHVTTVDGIVAQVMSLRSRHGQPPLLVVGHSHGGWLAMKVALALADRTTIQRLFTIDPISVVTCTPAVPVGCRTAPTDISPIQRQRIAAHTGRWLNYFETETTILHSSAIAEADTNTFLAIDHVSIHSSPMIWRQLQSEVNAITAE